MAPFRRALRILFGLAGFIAGAALAAAAYFARMMISPARQGLWNSPLDLGMDYEDIQFPARDGLRMSGWFIPAQSEPSVVAPTIVLVHGWTWNRLGYTANRLFDNLTGSKPLNLLPLIKSLHEQGYHVLTYDQRNHGQSADARPVTFGLGEAKDLLGAITYLSARDDVDRQRIGVVSFSLGANAALFALPQTSEIRAVIAIQPTTPALFSRRLAADLLGTPGGIIRYLAELIYRLAGGPRLAGINPAFAAAGSGGVPVLFIQGSGDRWGSADDVSQMAEMTPLAQEILYVNAHHRFDGYRYIVDNPGVARAFFEHHLK